MAVHSCGRQMTTHPRSIRTSVIVLFVQKHQIFQRHDTRSGVWRKLNHHLHLHFLFLFLSTPSFLIPPSPPCSSPSASPSSSHPPPPSLFFSLFLYSPSVKCPVKSLCETWPRSDLSGDWQWNTKSRPSSLCKPTALYFAGLWITLFTTCNQNIKEEFR